MPRACWFLLPSLAILLLVFWMLSIQDGGKDDPLRTAEAHGAPPAQTPTESLVEPAPGVSRTARAKATRPVRSTDFPARWPAPRRIYGGGSAR